MKLPRRPRHARGGEIAPPSDTSDRTWVRVSRGEAFLPSAAYDRVRTSAIAAMNGGDTHVYVIEPDGSITDTEENP